MRERSARHQAGMHSLLSRDPRRPRAGRSLSGSSGSFPVSSYRPYVSSHVTRLQRMCVDQLKAYAPNG
eukprot:5211874-Prymnesium_polylepis.1